MSTPSEEKHKAKKDNSRSGNERSLSNSDSNTTNTAGITAPASPKDIDPQKDEEATTAAAAAENKPGDNSETGPSESPARVQTAEENGDGVVPMSMPVLRREERIPGPGSKPGAYHSGGSHGGGLHRNEDLRWGGAGAIPAGLTAHPRETNSSTDTPAAPSNLVEARPVTDVDAQGLQIAQLIVNHQQG